MIYEVAATESCGCKLGVDIFRGNGFLQVSRALIVEALETWFEDGVL